MRQNAVQLVCRIDAVPGSGKTRVLISRIAHLIQERGISPRSILAITFTRKAAGQLQARIAASLGKKTASQVVSGNQASWILYVLLGQMPPLYMVWACCRNSITPDLHSPLRADRNRLDTVVLVEA